MTKDVVDIISGIITILVGIGSALLAIGIWAISGMPKFRLQQIFWFPHTPPSDTPFPIAIQFQIFTGAVGSKVTTEIEVESLHIEQPGKSSYSLTPFTSLELLELTDKKTTFAARTKEFSQIFLLEGSGSVVKHIGFHFDADQKFHPSEGKIAIKLTVNYTTYDPIRQTLSLIKLARSPIRRRATYVFVRSIDLKQANEMDQKMTTIWPYWYVEMREEQSAA
jgi:hypothetical protein